MSGRASYLVDGIGLCNLNAGSFGPFEERHLKKKGGEHGLESDIGVVVRISEYVLSGSLMRRTSVLR